MSSKNTKMDISDLLSMDLAELANEFGDTHEEAISQVNQAVTAHQEKITATLIEKSEMFPYIHEVPASDPIVQYLQYLEHEYRIRKKQNESSKPQFDKDDKNIDAILAWSQWIDYEAELEKLKQIKVTPTALIIGWFEIFRWAVNAPMTRDGVPPFKSKVLDNWVWVSLWRYDAMNDFLKWTNWSYVVPTYNEMMEIFGAIPWSKIESEHAINIKKILELTYAWEYDFEDWRLYGQWTYEMLWTSSEIENQDALPERMYIKVWAEKIEWYRWDWDMLATFKLLKAPPVLDRHKKFSGLSELLNFMNSKYKLGLMMSNFNLKEKNWIYFGIVEIWSWRKVPFNWWEIFPTYAWLNVETTKTVEMNGNLISWQLILSDGNTYDFVWDKIMSIVPSSTNPWVKIYDNWDVLKYILEGKYWLTIDAHFKEHVNWHNWNLNDWRKIPFMWDHAIKEALLQNVMDCRSVTHVNGSLMCEVKLENDLWYTYDEEDGINAMWNDIVRILVEYFEKEYAVFTKDIIVKKIPWDSSQQPAWYNPFYWVVTTKWWMGYPFVGNTLFKELPWSPILNIHTITLSWNEQYFTWSGKDVFGKDIDFLIEKEDWEWKIKFKPF